MLASRHNDAMAVLAEVLFRCDSASSRNRPWSQPRTSTCCDSAEDDDCCDCRNGEFPGQKLAQKLLRGTETQCVMWACTQLLSYHLQTATVCQHVYYFVSWPKMAKKSVDAYLLDLCAVSAPCKPVVDCRVNRMDDSNTEEQERSASRGAGRRVGDMRVLHCIKRTVSADVPKQLRLSRSYPNSGMWSRSPGPNIVGQKIAR